MIALGRGLRYARWAKRFLSFAELPEEAGFGAVTRSTTLRSSQICSARISGRHCGGEHRRTPGDL